MMPAEFHFLRPAWLAAIALVPIVFWWLWRRGGLAGGWLHVVSPELRPYVLDTTEHRRGSVVLPALASLVTALAVLALAGPAWERQSQTLFRGGDSLVVLLDLSRSMETADLPPSRITRAKLKLLDLLERRKRGQTALIVYSANAFTVVPLTDDTDTIGALVSSLSTDIMPSRGSYPGVALRKAQQLLQQAGAVRGQVLMIADGGYSPAASEAAAALAAMGFPVSVLGVGTPGGGPIPAPGGGFEPDRDGKLAVARLEEAELRRIASAGGGNYQRITADSTDLIRLLRTDDLGSREADAGGATQTIELWIDQGPWLVLMLLPLAALLFRRGWLLVFVGALFLTPLPNTAQAFSLRDLWLTPDQQAARKLEQGNPGAAAGLFRDPNWRGAALYRDGQYEASAEALAGLDSPDAHYNRGNALARGGRIEAAIDAYNAALALDPEHEDALYNKALLEQQQQQQQQQQNGAQSSESEPGQQADDSSDGEQTGDDQLQDRSGDTSEKSTPNEASASQSDDMNDGNGDEGESDDSDAALIDELQQALRERATQAEKTGDEETVETPITSAEARAEQEREEAIEQWLRRVPDDPGGLLRRKFRDQYRRQGRDQDGNSLWPDNTEEPW